MEQVVYVDILVCVNLFINYFILLCTTKFLKLKYKYIRILIGALIGSAYSLTILMPELNSILSLFLKFIFSIIIIMISFEILDLKTIIKAVACFYLINFGFCGLMFGIWYLLTPRGLLIRNGIIYFNISPIVFLVSTIISYICIVILNRLAGRQLVGKWFYDVEIMVGEKSCNIRAKIDTGNTLIEPFSNIPVIVTEYEYIKNVVPEELKTIILDKSLNGKEKEDREKLLLYKYRLVPFKTLSGSGILPAFKPDSIEIDGKCRKNREVYVAICKSGTLSKEYMGLINPELAEI